MKEHKSVIHRINWIVDILMFFNDLLFGFSFEVIVFTPIKVISLCIMFLFMTSLKYSQERRSLLFHWLIWYFFCFFLFYFSFFNFLFDHFFLYYFFLNLITSSFVLFDFHLIKFRFLFYFT